MLQNILKLEGVKTLSKTDQNQIHGGGWGHMGLCSNTKPNPTCFTTSNGCHPYPAPPGPCSCGNGQTLWWCDPI